MYRCFLGLGLIIAIVSLSASEVAQGQKKERRTGTVTGVIKSKKNTPNGKNVIIEVLAPGEEKPRPYRVQYDPKVKGPIVDVLKAVREANIGDKVAFDWIDTGEGLAITKFEVVKKEKDGREKK